ncbi:amino acid adenylation domain-containing protein [Sorangium sp. So ce291]|uniref:amino acid adenylation domain-containing protein n=1 Tax=Sorangium sp. So ce291 TaxID=3133294 RepID=UPI003F600913
MSDLEITGFSLSPQQRAIRELDRAAGPGGCMTLAVVAIAGPCDEERLSAALLALSERHEILRTRIVEVGGDAAQVVGEPRFAWSSREDWVGCPDAEQDERMSRLADRLSEGGGAEGGLRAGLVRVARVAPEERRLVLAAPAWCADEESIVPLVRELCALYAGTAEPAPVQQQYADVAEWLNETLESDAAGEGRRFWAERRSRFGPPLHLAFGRGGADAGQGRVQVDLGRDGLAQIERWSSAWQVPQRIVVLALWASLLWRMGGAEEPEATVAVRFDGRSLDQLAGAVGPFARLLPVRVGISASDTLADVARRFAAAEAEAAALQDVAPGVPHRMSWGFSAAEGAPALSLGGAAVRLLDVWSASAPVACELRCTGSGPSTSLELRYDASAGARRDAERLAERLAVMVEDLSRAPERPLALSEYVGPRERAELEAWSRGPAMDLPSPCALHALFEARAERHPDVIAVRSEGKSLSYGELERRANRLANCLRRRGVGPETIVGICLPRSEDMVIATLGVLKAGGAYLPLDHEYPGERLAFMMRDSRARLLITYDALADELPMDGWTTLLLDAEAQQIAACSDERPSARPLPEGAAYLIYTSGSTGKPKASVISHRAIVNQMQWIQRFWALTADDRVMLKAAFGFDVSVWEIFWPLAFGARIVVARAGGHRDPEYLRRLVLAEEVTTAYFVSSMLAAFLGGPEHQFPACLRKVLVGGEAVPLDLVRRFYAKHDGDLINMYGPSEAAIAVTGCVLPSDPRFPWVPLGAPVANGEVFVLDSAMRRPAIGVLGDLYIAGPPLARGYVGQPGLTAERFLPHPLARAAGERMYRTGDVARFMPDGMLEFQGRSDHQIKLRGHRIELGDVEAQIRRVPGVSQAAVVLREDAPGDARLVAYVVLDDPEEGQALDVRAALKNTLPVYMIPSSVVRLDALPLSPNGKLDRRALPAPEAQADADGSAEPRSPAERFLASIWGEVLGLRGVRVGENFFDVGGHSLLATQVVARVQRALGVEVPLQLMFDLPSIAAQAPVVELLASGRSVESLAPSIRGYVADPRPERLPALAPEEQEAVARRLSALGAAPPQVQRRGLTRAPLSYGQSRLYFLEQLSPGQPLFNVPGAVRLRGPLDAARLEAAFSEILRRHEALRTSIANVDGELLQVAQPHAGFALDVAPLAPEEAALPDLAARLRREAWRPFALGAPPLLRAKLFRLAEHEHVLLVTLHHIVSDDWSLGVILRELLALYAGATLAPPRLQYSDFAAWQREVVESGALDGQRAFWRERLRGLSGGSWSASGGAEGSSHDPSGVTEEIALPRDKATALEALARREGATLFMVLLAVLDIVLHARSGELDIAVGTPIANRNRPELEEVVGLLTNTLVLRVDLARAGTFRDVLARVRVQALDAFANQDIPFDVVTQDLKQERDHAQHPLFRVWLALQNAPKPMLDAQGLRVEPLPLRPELVHFEVALLLWPADDRSLIGHFEFRRDRVDEGARKEIVAAFNHLVDQVIARADAPLSALVAGARAEAEKAQAARGEAFARAATARLGQLRRRSTSDPTSGE